MAGFVQYAIQRNAQPINTGPLSKLCIPTMVTYMINNNNNNKYCIGEKDGNPDGEHAEAGAAEERVLHPCHPAQSGKGNRVFVGLEPYYERVCPSVTHSLSQSLSPPTLILPFICQTNCHFEIRYVSLLNLIIFYAFSVCHSVSQSVTRVTFITF